MQNVDLSIPDYYVRRACNLPEEAGAPHTGSTKPHIVLRTPSGVLLTSVALFFRKAAVELTFEGKTYLVVPQAAILVLVKDPESA